MAPFRTTVLVSLAAGVGQAGAANPAIHDTNPTTMEGRVRAAGPAIHFYLNPATGERLANRASGGQSEPVWIADNDTPCAAFGVGTPAIFLADDPSSTQPIATDAVYLDWGDIPFDTVVDCVQLSVYTEHPDTDSDGDGIADGVYGFAATWTWYDADNGGHGCTRTELVSMTLLDIPGTTTPGVVQGYVFTVELSATDWDFSFELGDTDGDPQGAAHFNPFIGEPDSNGDGIRDADLDGDGLLDFSYAQRFHQPGTLDYDGDGQPDGDPANAARTYMRVVAPTGPAVLGDDGWTIDPVAPLPAAQGLEDRFSIFTDLNGDGILEEYGTFWLGGFSCDSAAPKSYAQFAHALFGPDSSFVPCPADLFPSVPDGILNFFDMSAFVGLYQAQDPRADLFPFDHPDGQFNFYDFYAFIYYINFLCH